MTFKSLLLIVVAIVIGCHGKRNRKMEEFNNPLLCNPTDGVCSMPERTFDEVDSVQHKQSKTKILYFTDPICSSCWGIEPQLRKLKLVYGNQIEIEYHMGGLLPDWSYNSGGISKPSDVAHHWDEVSQYYDMPIDGDVWLEDPLASSFPPSIAFKAAQLQSETKALLFLRAMREQVFLQKKNITRWSVLEDAANKVGLDVVQLKRDFDNQAKSLFEADLKLAHQNGVRGFPTLLFIDAEGNKQMVYGAKSYAFFESVLSELDGSFSKNIYPKDWRSLFAVYPSLTAREFSELSEIPRNQSEKVLDALVDQGFLDKMTTKNGALWQLKNR